MSERIWYKARLKEAASNIYTESFYPEAKKRTGTRWVWFTQEDVTSQNQRVLVTSGMSRNKFRMMTLELALAFLEPACKATKAETTMLNDLSSHLERNI
jgi:hypothetical protein